MTSDELNNALKEGGYEMLLATLDPETIQLMNAATALYERFSIYAQTVCLALMFGTLCGVVEGEPTQWEKDNRELITFADRMRLFTTIAQVTFDAAMKARQDPNCPQPRRM